MIGAKGFLADDQGSLEQRFSLGVTPLVFIQASQAA
jgi:hypothetical protein